MRAWDDPRVRSGMQTQLAKRRARIAAGEAPLGWKVGFGAPAAMQKLQISAPLIAFLMRKALLASGATVSLSGWSKPAAEPEIAVYVGTDLRAGGDREDARKAIAALGPAIELADVDGPVDDVESILSGGIFQRHVALGPRDVTRAGVRLDGLRGRLARSGRDLDVPADLESNVGDIVGIVSHVADVLGAFDETLRAGDVVITGSVTPPLTLQPEDSEIAFNLHPIGGVSVRFASA